MGAQRNVPLGYIGHNAYNFRFAVPAGTYTVRAQWEAVTVDSGQIATVHVSTVCRGFADE